MRRTLAWLCTAGLVIGTTAAQAQSGQRIDRSTLLHLGASVLKIEAIGADGRYQLGSGVVVGERKAVTNCHVTRNAQTIHVVKAGVRLPATQQAADVAHDLCVLHVPRLDGADAVVPIAPAGSLKAGQGVLAVGYTGGVGLQVSDGEVVALHRHDGSQIVQSTNWFSSGASGGGLFDAAGRLVGILTFRLRGGAAHYFAAPADWLTGRIDDNVRYAAIGPLEGRSFWEELPDAQPMFLQAAALEQRRQWPGLAALAERWAKDDAADPEAPYVLGLAYDAQGDTQASIAALRRCIELDPGYARAWARLALLYKRDGRLADAREALARLGALDPDQASELTKDFDPK